MDWLNFLAVQVTLKGLLQHHSSKESILRYSAVFTVQLSHPYMTTGKTQTKEKYSYKTKIRLLHLLSRSGTTHIPKTGGGKRQKQSCHQQYQYPLHPLLGFSRNTSEGGLGEEETALTSYISDNSI